MTPLFVQIPKARTLPNFRGEETMTTRGGVENFPTLGVRQGSLELTGFPHSLDNTRNTKMLYSYCLHPTSTVLLAKPRVK